MQISRDSWHYKLVRSKTPRWDDVPGNLCPYMRRLFWSIACYVTKKTAIGVGILLAAFVVISPLLYAFHHYIMEFLPASWLVMDEKNTTLFMLAFIVGCAAYAVSGGLLLWLAGKEGVERFQYSDWNRERKAAKRAEQAALPPKPPSVFVEWLKGIHNKTCSSLEFVDDAA